MWRDGEKPLLQKNTADVDTVLLWPWLTDFNPSIIRLVLIEVETKIRKILHETQNHFLRRGEVLTLRCRRF